MKNLYVLLLLITFIVLSHAVKAQSTTTTKPALFAAYPQELSCTEAQLADLFNKPVNAVTQLNTGNGFVFTGTVKSSVQKYDNLKTVIIESTNFPGAVFSISLLSDQYTSEHYVGRIISMNHSDLFELQFENNQYKLVKKQFKNVIPACPQ